MFRFYLSVKLKNKKIFIGCILLTFAYGLGLFSYSQEMLSDSSGYEAILEIISFFNYFLFVIPLVSGLFSTMYYTNKSNNYIYFIVARLGLKRYYLIEIITSFIISALISLVSYTINVTLAFGIHGNKFYSSSLLGKQWGHDYNAHPLLFIICIGLNLAITSGFLTLFAISTSNILKKKLLISISPFMYLAGFTMIIPMVSKVVGLRFSRFFGYFYPSSYILPFTVNRPNIENSQLKYIDMGISWLIFITIVFILLYNMYKKDKRELI